MNVELLSFKSVCATIQREESRRKVMSRTVTPCNPGVSAYLARPYSEGKVHKGKRPNLKCRHCHNIGHTIDRCWSLHLEIKPKFNKDQKGKSVAQYKANSATNHTESFTSSLVALLNEFAHYLQNKHGKETTSNGGQNQTTTILSQFAGFLAYANSEKKSRYSTCSYDCIRDW